MSTDTLPAVRNSSGAAPARIQLGGSEAMKQTIEDLNTIREFVRAEMQVGRDFGVIPGTGDKPTLLQPGAQKINMYFNVYPEYEVHTEHLDKGHITVTVKTRLLSRTSQTPVGNGIGSCSSMESKYRWRQQSRSCPDCGKAETIIKGKKEYGGGWLCFGKKGGCGAKFDNNDRRIIDQPLGRVENPDIFDSHNTVLKMAKKRSLVDATHGLGCMSELFTQDLEDFAPEPETDQATSSRPASTRQGATDRKATGEKPTTGAPQNAGSDQAAKFLAWCRQFVEDTNLRWLDERTVDGKIARGIEELLNGHQVVLHLLKWALREGRIRPAGLEFDPETGKPRETVGSTKAARFVAVLFASDRQALLDEARAYASDLAQAARDAWRTKHGERDADPDCDPDDLETTEAGARG